MGWKFLKITGVAEVGGLENDLGLGTFSAIIRPKLHSGPILSQVSKISPGEPVFFSRVVTSEEQKKLRGEGG